MSTKILAEKDSLTDTEVTIRRMSHLTGFTGLSDSPPTHDDAHQATARPRPAREYAAVSGGYTRESYQHHAARGDARPSSTRGSDRR